MLGVPAGKSRRNRVMVASLPLSPATRCQEVGGRQMGPKKSVKSWGLGRPSDTCCPQCPLRLLPWDRPTGPQASSVLPTRLAAPGSLGGNLSRDLC